MAGKHVGAWQNTNDPLPGFEWNERTTKAYAEGRYNIAPNGHVAGSDAYRAYVAGAANASEDDQAFESGGGPGGGGPPAIRGYVGNYYADTTVNAGGLTMTQGTAITTAADDNDVYYVADGSETVISLGAYLGNTSSGGNVEVGLYSASPASGNTNAITLVSEIVTFAVPIYDPEVSGPLPDISITPVNLSAGVAYLVATLWPLTGGGASGSRQYYSSGNRPGATTGRQETDLNGLPGSWTGTGFNGNDTVAWAAFT